MKRHWLAYGIIAALLTLSLTACGSTTPSTVPQATYEGTATFVAALKAANVYAALPRCTASKPPCSDQSIVNQEITAANRADTAVKQAQAVARDPTTPASTRTAAIQDANAAIQALVGLLPPTAPATK